MSDGHKSNNNSESFILFKQSQTSSPDWQPIFFLSLSDHHEVARQKGVLQETLPVVSVGHFVNVLQDFTQKTEVQ